MKKEQQGKRKKMGGSPKARPRKTRGVAVPDPSAENAGPIVVELPAPISPGDRREAEQFVKVLDANRQISRSAGPLPPGATHQVETDATGSRRLKRKRFSAL